MFEISASALTAIGTHERALCCFVPSKEAANAKFVEKFMAGKVEYL
jgi:hypothetical protein